MAAATTVLLMLTVMVAPVYLQQNCSVGNTTGSSGDFTLAVTPATYIANTNYTVTVNGAGNVTYVRFQASEGGSNHSPSSWFTDNVTNACPDSSDIYINGSASLVAHWKSTNGTSATIRAFIAVNNGTTYIVVHDLKIASTTTPMAPERTTVSAPTASNTATLTLSTVKRTDTDTTTASNPTTATVSTVKRTDTDTTTASNPTTVTVSTVKATVSNATKASNPTTVTVSTVKATVSNATKESNATTVTVSTVKTTNSANSASYSSWILIALLVSAYMAVNNRVMC